MPSFLDEPDTDDISDAEAEDAKREAFGELEDETAEEGPSDVEDLQASTLCRAGWLTQHTLSSQIPIVLYCQVLNLEEWSCIYAGGQVCVPDCGRNMSSAPELF